MLATVAIPEGAAAATTTLAGIFGPSVALAAAATLIALAVLVGGLALEARAERRRRQLAGTLPRLRPTPMTPVAPTIARTVRPFAA